MSEIIKDHFCHKIQSFKSIVKAYDIRGLYQVNLFNYHGYLLGLTYALAIEALITIDEFIASNNNKEARFDKKSLNSNFLFIGHDCRASSLPLYQGLNHGITDGLKISKLQRNISLSRKSLLPRYLGLVHTPIIYYACGRNNSGIMVTASHNPIEYNGFKMVLYGLPLYGRQLLALLERMQDYITSIIQTLFSKKFWLWSYLSPPGIHKKHYLSKRNNISYYDGIILQSIAPTLENKLKTNTEETDKIIYKGNKDIITCYLKYLDRRLKIITSLKFIETKRQDSTKINFAQQTLVQKKSNKKLQSVRKVLWDLTNGATHNIVNKLIPYLRTIRVNTYDIPILHKIINNQDNNLAYDPKLLAKIALEEGFELGIRFDQDGDRIELFYKGQVIKGEVILVLLAQCLYQNADPGTIIVDIKVSSTIINYLTALGFKVLICRTGHVFIKDKMRQENAMLAGEASGHIYHSHDSRKIWRNLKNSLTDPDLSHTTEGICYYDDAIFTAIEIIGLLLYKPNILDYILASLPKTFVTPEIKLPIQADLENIIEQIKVNLLTSYGIAYQDDLFCEEKNYTLHLGKISLIGLDGIRYEHKELGWWLLRRSNTEECLIVRVEGYTLDNYKLLIRAVNKLLSDQDLGLKILEEF